MWKYLVNIISIVVAVFILYKILTSVGLPPGGLVGFPWSTIILVLVVVLTIYVLVKRFKKLF